MNKSTLKKSKYAILATLIISACAIISSQTIYSRDICIAHAANDADDIYYGTTLSDYDGDFQGTVKESISYTTKYESETKLINNSFPCYYNTNNDIDNVCANVAGANLIGYYDRYLENLIPNYTPGLLRGNIYKYYPMSANQEIKQNLIDDLYIRMSTNAPKDGTTESNFKYGLSSYANSKGYNTIFSSAMANSNLDMAIVTKAIDEGKPTILYLSGFNLCLLDDDGNHAVVTKKIFHANHILIAYGYYNVSYYNDTNELIKTNTYIYVASGLQYYTGLFVLNEYGTLNDAETIYIY